MSTVASLPLITGFSIVEALLLQFRTDPSVLSTPAIRIRRLSRTHLCFLGLCLSAQARGHTATKGLTPMCLFDNTCPVVNAEFVMGIARLVRWGHLLHRHVLYYTPAHTAESWTGN